MSVSQLIDLLLTKQYSELDKYITEISKNGIKLQLIVSLVNSMTLVGLNKDAVDGLRHIFCQSAFRYYMYENTQLLQQLINLLPVTDDENSQQYIGFLLFIFETIFKQSLLQFNDMNQTPLHQLLYKIDLNNGINKNFVPQFLYQIYQRINDRQVFDRLLREQDHLGKSSYDYLKALSFIEGESIQLVIKLVSQYTPSANQTFIRQQQERQLNSKILNTQELEDHITQNIIQNTANTLNTSELQINNLEVQQQAPQIVPTPSNNIALTVTNLSTQQTLPEIQSNIVQNSNIHQTQEILLSRTNESVLKTFNSIPLQQLQPQQASSTLPQFVEMKDNNDEQLLFKDIVPQSNTQQSSTNRTYRFQKLLQSGTQSFQQHNLLSHSNSHTVSNISSNKSSDQPNKKMEVVITETLPKKANSQSEKYVIIKDSKVDSFIDEIPSQLIPDTDFSFTQVKSPQQSVKIENLQQPSPKTSNKYSNEIKLQQNLVQNDLPEFVPRPQLPPQIVDLGIQTSEIFQEKNQPEKPVFIQLINNSENKTLDDSDNTQFSAFNALTLQQTNNTINDELRLKTVNIGTSALNCSGLSAEKQQEVSIQATQNQQNKSTQFIQDKQINQTTSNLLSSLGRPKSAQTVILPGQTSKTPVKIQNITISGPKHVMSPQVTLVKTPQRKKNSEEDNSPQRSPEVKTHSATLTSSKGGKTTPQSQSKLKKLSKTSPHYEFLTNSRATTTLREENLSELVVSQAKKMKASGINAFSQTLKTSTSVDVQTGLIQNYPEQLIKTVSQGAQTQTKQSITSPQKVQIQNVAIDYNDNVHVLTESQKKKHVKRSVEVEVLSTDALKGNKSNKKQEKQLHAEKQIGQERKPALKQQIQSQQLQEIDSEDSEQQKQIQTDPGSESVKFHIDLQNLLDQNTENLKSIVGKEFHVNENDVSETARTVCGNRSHILSNINSLDQKQSHIGLKSQLESLINVQKTSGSQLTQTQLQYQQEYQQPIIPVPQMSFQQIPIQFTQLPPQTVQNQINTLQVQKQTSSLSNSPSVAPPADPSMISIMPQYAEIVRQKPAFQDQHFQVQQLNVQTIQQNVQPSFDQSIQQMSPLQPGIQFGESGVQTLDRQQSVQLIDMGVGPNISHLPTMVETGSGPALSRIPTMVETGTGPTLSRFPTMTDASAGPTLSRLPSMQDASTGVTLNRLPSMTDVGIGPTLSRIPTMSSNISSPREIGTQMSQNVQNLQNLALPPQPRTPQRQNGSVLRSMTAPVNQLTNDLSHSAPVASGRSPTSRAALDVPIGAPLSRSSSILGQKNEIPVEKDVELQLSQILAAGSARIAAGEELLGAPKPRYDVSDIPSLKMSDRFMTQYQVRQQGSAQRAATAELPSSQQLANSSTQQLPVEAPSFQQPQVSVNTAYQQPQLHTSLPVQATYVLPQPLLQQPFQGAYSQVQQSLAPQTQQIPHWAMINGMPLYTQLIQQPMTVPQVQQFQGQQSEQQESTQQQQQQTQQQQQQQEQQEQQQQLQTVKTEKLLQSSIFSEDNVQVSVAKVQGKQKPSAINGISVQCDLVDDLTLSEGDDVQIQQITTSKKQNVKESLKEENLIVKSNASAEVQQSAHSHEVSVKLSRTEMREQLDDIISPNSGSTIMSSARFSKMVQSHPDKSIGGLVPELLKAQQ